MKNRFTKSLAWLLVLGMIAFCVYGPAYGMKSDRDRCVKKYGLEVVQDLESRYAGTEVYQDIQLGMSYKGIRVFYNTPQEDLDKLFLLLRYSSLGDWETEEEMKNRVRMSCEMKVGEAYLVTDQYFSKNSVEVFDHLASSPGITDQYGIRYPNVINTPFCPVIITPKKNFTHYFYMDNPPARLNEFEDMLMIKNFQLQDLIYIYTGKYSAEQMRTSWNKYKKLELTKCEFNRLWNIYHKSTS